MSNISATMVVKLREMTGLGMLDCKKALVEANGDLKKAEEILRVKSGAKAGKVANRTTAEGIVSVFISENHKSGALVEVNCETDFVAKDTNFTQFVELVAQVIVENKIEDLEKLSLTIAKDGKSLEEMRKELIAKLGENISIRRFSYFTTEGKLISYLHGKKIGVLLDYVGDDEEVGKDIAMHIVANKPICVSKDQVSAEKIDQERNIYHQQASNLGKPEEIIKKMVEGRVHKFLAEVTLLGQQFVKNPDITIASLLESKKSKVNRFSMIVVGEGIEKKEVDFAAEVAAAAVVK